MTDRVLMQPEPGPFAKAPGPDMVALTPEEQLRLQAEAALVEEVGEFTIELPRDGNELLDMAPEDLAFIDRLLYARKARQAQVATYEAIAERRKQDIDAWLTVATASLQSSIQYLDGVLLQVAKHLRFPGKAKSLSLPAGRLGRRAQADRLEVVNMEAAVAFAKDRGIPVQVKETVLVSDLKEYWQSTDEVPTGCALDTNRPDKPYVE